MWTRTVQAWGVVALVVTCTSAARAECEAGADCKHEAGCDRCEVKAAPRTVGAWDSAETRRAEYDAEPTTRSHSVPMLITGIALVVAAPVLFIVAVESAAELNPCPDDVSGGCAAFERRRHRLDDRRGRGAWRGHSADRDRREAGDGTCADRSHAVTVGQPGRSRLAPASFALTIGFAASPSGTRLRAP
jgi:hypothetical protein